MTNEELVALIQGGERERLPELWNRAERFVAPQAHRRLVLSDGMGRGAFGDLCNAGYLALFTAAETHDPTAKRAFIGWLAVVPLKSAKAPGEPARMGRSLRSQANPSAAGRKFGWF